MQQLPILKPGDTVEIIAPASRCSMQELTDLKNLLISWQLNCFVSEDIFGDELFCANTDEIRFKNLSNALYNSTTTAIICARGGYGSMRLIPELSKLLPPEKPKWFVGMSDITALHLYFQQHWNWPTLHGALMPNRFSDESIAAVKTILFAETPKIEFSDLIPLNLAAKNNQTINSTLTGGNLCLIQAGIGTNWQIEAKNKLILLEEINERGYRVDRMLEHLRQSGVFKQAAGILLADFLDGKELNGTSLIEPTLQRFAISCEIPVVKISGIGHGHVNFPVPLGFPTQLQCGEKAKLTISR